MTRRQFCRWLLTICTLAYFKPLFRATSRPLYFPDEAGTDSGRLTDNSGLARISLIATTDRAYGVRRALELFGENPVRGNRVLLKPNFNSAHRAPGSTHEDVLRSLVHALSDMGSRAITMGDRSGMGATHAVMQQKGVFSLAKNLGFNVVAFDELDRNEWVIRQSRDFHWSRGYAVPKMLLETECVVQTCNLKTHRFGGHFTLSLKNSVGFAAKQIGRTGHNYMGELHGSQHQRYMIAEINQSYEPSLIVMDGVEAFVNGGPESGKRVSPNVVLVGSDRVAMDAVGVALLRMYGTTPEVSRGPVFAQEQIARAVELGLGVDSASKIELVTGDAASEAYAAKVRETLEARG